VTACSRVCNQERSDPLKGCARISAGTAGGPDPEPWLTTVGNLLVPKAHVLAPSSGSLAASKLTLDGKELGDGLVLLLNHGNQDVAKNGLQVTVRRNSVSGST
jgi:hypothetical protein